MPPIDYFTLCRTGARIAGLVEARRPGGRRFIGCFAIGQALLVALAMACVGRCLVAQQTDFDIRPLPPISTDRHPLHDQSSQSLLPLPPSRATNPRDTHGPLAESARSDAAPTQNSNGQPEIEHAPAAELPEPAVEPMHPSSIPGDFTPWWQAAVLRPLRRSPADLSVDVNSLIVDALQYSVRVRAISDNAVIAQTGITRADAEFDTHAFMESKFVRSSTPTGNSLEAGFDATRLREEDWFYRAGLRRKNRYGGQFEVAQKIGLKDSNSTFFIPDNQGNARLTLSYNHPLLNGAGRGFNNSLILLANIDTQIAMQRTATELQDHLLAVTESMWELYFQRTVLLQRKRHLDRAQVILQRLDKRRDMDSLDSQIARARAAVSMRQAELIRAATTIRNAEARVRALVNSPTMLANRQSELVPSQPPIAEFVPVGMQEAVLTALENRPEINAATREIEAACVRLDVARNELMPVLDVVLETYVSGLRGDNGISPSLADQFSVGEPSYTAGLLFEVPIHQRAARANFQRRKAEIRQLTNRLQNAIETLHAEVEVAVREVETTRRELDAKYTSMVAADVDVQYLQRRWEELPGDDRAASFLLADVLDAQDRLAIEEYGFAQAQIACTLSYTRLNRATGTLLKHERVELITDCEDCLPTVRFVKEGVLTETNTAPSHD